jgi:hypothetical protein
VLPHDFALTFDQLEASILVLKSGRGPWDEEWRHRLVRMAKVLVTQLWQVGIEEIYLDGSFVERKPHPNDIDGYFVCEVDQFFDVQLPQLETLDNCWTWDEDRLRFAADTAKPQLPMWHKYRTELYPHYAELSASGIKGPTGEDLTFPDAFRRRRDDFQPKGLIRMIQ